MVSGGVWWCLVVSGGLWWSLVVSVVHWVRLVVAVVVDCVLLLYLYPTHHISRGWPPWAMLNHYERRIQEKISKSMTAAPQTRIFNAHTCARTNHVNCRFHIV